MFPNRYCLPREHGSQVFQLTSIDDSAATMTHRPILSPECIVQVPLDQLKRWRLSKKDMPVLASPEIMGKGLPLANLQVVEDFQKAQITMALRQAFQSHSVGETQVACSANPQGVWAIQPIKKTQFKLVPLGPISKAKEGQEHKLYIQHFGAKWAIGNWKQNASLSQDHDGILVPFSWVKEAPTAEEANLQWGHLKQDGIDIPILVPKHGIEKNQQLLHEDASNMAQAKKKAKKA